MKLRLALLIIGAGTAGLAAPPPLVSTAEPISGTLLARRDDQTLWQQVSRSSASPWLYTESGGQAVVVFANQSRLRMAEGTLLHTQSSGAASLQLEMLSGQVFADVPPGQSVSISTPGGRVESGGGNFIVRLDGQNAQVRVLEGRTRLYGGKLSLDGFGPLGALQEVALQPGLDGSLAFDVDGPDVRVRDQKRKRFTQGEENQGRRLGETETPSPSPSPSATATPPIVTQPPPPQNPPPPPEEGPPVEVDGGGDIWPYVAGALGAAGLAIFLNNLDDDEDAVFFNQIPASP